MQRLTSKRVVVVSGSKPCCVTEISGGGEERRNARPNDTPSVPLAPETERFRGQGRQISPLDFASDSFRLVPTVTVGTRGTRRSASPKRSHAERGNERISDGTLDRMTPHQFLLLQRQNGLEETADKLHPLTLRAIRRNILPSSAPNSGSGGGGLALIHPELSWILDLPDWQAGLTLPMPPMQIFRREQQRTGTILNSLDTALLQPRAKKKP
jgi:hypothetical protein